MHHAHPAQSAALKQRNRHVKSAGSQSSFNQLSVPNASYSSNRLTPEHALRNPPSPHQKLHRSPDAGRKCVSTEGSRSPRRATSPSSERRNSDLPAPSPRPRTNLRNYRIKSIRRGIPDIVTTDVKGRSFRIARKGMKFTHNCVCRKDSKKRRSAVAWTFSLFVVLICGILPLLSFTGDIMFFLVSQRQFNATGEFLQTARVLVPPNVTSHVNLPAVTREHQDWHRTKHGVKRTQTRHRKHRRSADVPLALVNVLKKQNPTSQGVSTTPTTALAVTVTKNQTFGSDKVCGQLIDVLRFMTTDDASSSLKTHIHVITEVLEPIIIIGSFPSVILCIFTRLVVMITSHDHLISAFVINVLVLPLQLITGAMSVHAVSHRVGTHGFDCWECAVTGVCPRPGWQWWYSKEVNMSLMLSLAAKMLDGVAGGCVIFTVMLRSIWKYRGHSTVWKQIAKVLITMTSAITCMPLAALLVATPALAALRYEYIEKVPDFDGKENTTFMVMVLFATGVSAWCSSMFALFLYIVYRSYVYCRMKEHSSSLEHF